MLLAGLVPKSAELQDLFKSIEALKADLEGFKRPDGLPPPGEKLPALPVRTPLPPTYTFSVTSAGGSRLQLQRLFYHHRTREVPTLVWVPSC